jgi:gluconolactonase
VISPNAKIEKLAEGFTWSEGPAWVPAQKALFFSDVPANTMYRWSEKSGASVFMKPSGYAGPDLGVLREPGSNGLFAEPGGTLLVANSGDRLVERLDLATKKKTTLAQNLGGLRFNSPNDVVRRSDGVVFFTDPPYGLKDGDQSKVKELHFNGVYRVDLDGRVVLLDDSLTLPNGVGLSPDERTLYVANSDPQRPIWMAYELDAKGDVVSKRLFADATDLKKGNVPGLPDGLTVAADGTLFASAPGGMLIMTPQGKRLGMITTGGPISNCDFGDDGRTLYMTAGNYIARTRLAMNGWGK